MSDNGGKNQISNGPTNVYDWEAIPPGKKKVLIGDGQNMRVMSVGSLNLTMHSNTDFNFKLTKVYVTEGIGFNLFSLHDVQARQTITLDKDGAHFFDKRLTFPRDATGSCLYATRMNPAPTIRLTAVPALSSDPSVVPCGVQHAPPLLDPSVPQPQAPLKVDGAEPLVSGSPTLSHQRVEGVVPAGLGLPPAEIGIVPPDLGFRPAVSGIVPADLGFPPAEIGRAPVDSGFPPAVSGIVPVDTRFPPTSCGVVPQGSCLPPMTSVRPRVGPTVQCTPSPITVQTPEVKRGRNLQTVAKEGGEQKSRKLGGGEGAVRYESVYARKRRPSPAARAHAQKGTYCVLEMTFGS